MFSVQETAEKGVENEFCKVDRVSPILWILGETGFAAATFADEAGYFKLIPKQFPQYGKIVCARISAPGAERRKIGWNSNGIALPSSSQGIELHQPDYNVSYTGQYINSGSSMAVLGRSSLNVKDVTIDAGGELILTSSKYIKVDNEFLAKPSSRAYFLFQILHLIATILTDTEWKRDVH